MLLNSFRFLFGPDVVPPTILGGQLFYYLPSSSLGTTLATVSATDNIGTTKYRFATTQSQYSPDGFYQIDNSGHLSLTSVGANDGIDPNWTNVTMLLKPEGSNASTYVADYTKNRVFTAVGDAKLSNAQIKFGATSLSMSGTGYLTTPTTTDFDILQGDFTVEAWIYVSSNAPVDGDGLRKMAMITANTASTATSCWYFGLLGDANTTGTGMWFGFTDSGGTAHTATCTYAFSLNTWYHVAVCRNSGGVTFYVNGTKITPTADGIGTTIWTTGTTNVTRIGNNANATWPWYFIGYLDEIRITKGLARYTATFTPDLSTFPGGPDAYYSQIAVLARGDSGSIKDYGPRHMSIAADSSSASAISTDGKFHAGCIKIAAGTSTQVGWNNNSNFLFPGDFTVEGWFKFLSSNANVGLIGMRTTEATNRVGIATTSGVLTMNRFNSSTYPTFGNSTSTPVNTWFHFAMTRANGNFYVYVNGAYLGTTPDSGLVSNGVGSIYIGGSSATDVYVDDFRVTYGVARTSGTVAYPVPRRPYPGGSTYGLNTYVTSSGVFPYTVQAGDAANNWSTATVVSTGVAGPVVSSGQTLSYTSGKSANTIVGTVSASDLGTPTINGFRFGKTSSTYSEDYCYSINASGQVAITTLGAASGVDPNYSQVSILLPGNGNNGTTIADYGPNNLQFTKNGTASFSSAQSKFYGKSMSFTNGGDSFSTPSNAVFQFGTGDFTVECWIYPTAYTTGIYLMHVAGLERTGTDSLWVLGINTSAKFLWYVGHSGNSIVSTTSVPLNAWTHLAASRNGSTVRLFVNGNLDASGTDSSSYDTYPYNFSVGTDSTGNSNGQMKGYLQDLRITKGLGRYTSSFTPLPCPTTGDASWSSVSMLTHADSLPLVDVKNGFTPTSASIPDVINTDGVFGTGCILLRQGTGDSLQWANQAALLMTGDFTAEAWFKFPSSVANLTLINWKTTEASGRAEILTDGTGTLLFNQAGSNSVAVGGFVLPVNSWIHFVWSRVGSTNYVYVNGVQVGTFTNGTTFGNGTGGVVFNASTTSDTLIDEIRITKGLGRYTASVIPVPVQRYAQGVDYGNNSYETTQNTFVYKVQASDTAGSWSSPTNVTLQLTS